MGTIKPQLPDPDAVPEHIKEWAATHPRFARFLNARVPAAEALARWAQQLLRAKRIPLAISVLRSALALTPGDPVLWANYGIALCQSNSPEEAIACLEYSVALSRQQPSTGLLLGLSRKKQGDLAGAEAAYRVALEQKPDSSLAWQ